MWMLGVFLGTSDENSAFKAYYLFLERVVCIATAVLERLFQGPFHKNIGKTFRSILFLNPYLEIHPLRSPFFRAPYAEKPPIWLCVKAPVAFTGLQTL